MNPMTMQSPAPTPRSQAQSAPMSTRPFTAGAFERVEPAWDVSTAPGGTTTQEVPPTSGFLRSVILFISAVTTGNSANVAFTADGPWSALSEIVLMDTNGAPIFGPLSGYDLFLVNKYGGYDFQDDPTSNAVYSAVTGTSGPGGSYTFALRIPVEIVGRDAIGALANMSASTTFKIRYSIAPNAAVYATAPTTPAAVVRVRAWAETWSQPPAIDYKGRMQRQVPPGDGTLQMWSKQTVNIAAGSQNVRVTRTGNLVRNIILVNRLANGARDTASFPDPITVEWDARTLANVSRDLVRLYTSERYGYALPDAGVFVWNFCHDFDGKPGGELRDLWLPTNSATRLEYRGVFGAAGTVDLLVNDVAVAGDLES